jgi:radical SAM superfamily enzyme with C-terminal helix-hairpin-helix motif
MLEKLIPFNTVLKEVYTEKYVGKLTFGRQVGSYPILVGIPGIQPINEFIDVKIIDYGYRSITGIPFPLDINQASRESIESIPGIGKKRAIRILANRPFKNKQDLTQALDEKNLINNLQNYIFIKR